MNFDRSMGYDAILKAARQIILSSGLTMIGDTQVPFTYHHDWFRMNRSDLSRGDVAVIMRCMQDDDWERAIRATVAGCLLFLAGNPDHNFITAFRSDERLRDLFNWAMNVPTVNHDDFNDFK